MANWKCPVCLRPLHRFGNQTECARCRSLRTKDDLDMRDIAFLANALIRQIKSALGYWPPRWARNS